MRSREDYYSNTVADAADFARRHADPVEDNRPTAAELADDEFRASIECPDCGAGYADVRVQDDSCYCEECECEWELGPEDPDEGYGGCGGCRAGGYCACIMG